MKTEIIGKTFNISIFKLICLLDKANCEVITIQDQYAKKFINIYLALLPQNYIP